MTRHKKLIILVGPTAVGKTAVAIEIARRYGTEIISADSRQIFRELKIGTAKPSPSELAEAPHHFINTHSVTEEYDAASFGRDALALISKLFQKHDYLVLCGGSGLYIRAVCEGFDDIPEIDASVRDQLISDFESFGIGYLQEKMKSLDPDFYLQIDVQNPHRLIRALEVIIGTGQSISHFRQRKKLEHAFDIVKIGLELPRDTLFARIDSRMDQMIVQGLFEEASELYPSKDRNALQTVGYQEIFGYIEKRYDYEEAVRLLKRNSRRYAKRQLTWFRRDPDIVWKDPSDIQGIFELTDRNNNE